MEQDASSTDPAVPPDQVVDGRGQYGLVFRPELLHIAQHETEPGGRLSRGAVQAVWVALATFANRDQEGAAFPSDATLAGVTGMSPGNVRRCRDYLRTIGMLTWVERYKDGHQTSNAYTLVGLSEQARAKSQPGACIPPQPDARKARDDHSPDQAPPPDQSQKASRGDAVALCEQLADSLGKRDKRPTVTERWVRDMDLLLRIDKRDPAQVARVIAWLDAGAVDPAPFWRSVIRSPGKLRAKWGQMADQVHARRARTGQTMSEQDDTVRSTIDQMRGAFTPEQPELQEATG